MIRLLYITNGINGAGGLERVLALKASYLAEHYDYNVTILSLNKNHINPFYTFSPKINMLSIDVNGNPIQYFKSYKKGIQRVVDEVQPDIISVCDDGLKGFFIPSIIKTKAKLIYERHASINLNIDKGLKGKFMRWLMISHSRKFDRYIVLTKENGKEWNGRNLQVIPNPLSFIPRNNSSLDNKRVLVVGSHSYNKGYDTLLEMWKCLSKKFPNWHLHIFGKFDQHKVFVKLAEQNAIKNCNFYSPISNIEKEYLTSDILFLTSRSEGFGMVLIEAMACGVPCIAFDCPSGPRDIISDGEDGFLVENQNMHDFINKATELMSDAKKLKAMGISAKRNVLRYREDKIVNEWDRLFRDLLK